jgi:hypothetical protein
MLRSMNLRGGWWMLCLGLRGEVETPVAWIGGFIRALFAY